MVCRQRNRNGRNIGEFAETLQKVMDQLAGELSDYNNEVKEKTGDGIYEHLLGRIKSEESMREKCDRRGIPQTAESALRVMTDSVGLRVITRFIVTSIRLSGF